MIDCYDKMTIKKYRELLKIDKDGMDDTEYGVQILAVLSDLPEEDLLDMPLDQFTEMMAKTKFIYQPINRLDFKHLGTTLKINDKEYTIIKDAKKMTAGQYIDYTNYIKQPFIDILPYLLTVFILPKDCKYGEGYEIEELAKELDSNLDIRTALCLSDFFQYQSKLSIKISISYLKTKMKMMMKTEKNEERKKMMTEAIAQMESLESLMNSSVGFISL